MNGLMNWSINLIYIWNREEESVKPPRSDNYRLHSETIIRMKMMYTQGHIKTICNEFWHTGLFPYIQSHTTHSSALVSWGYNPLKNSKWKNVPPKNTNLTFH